MLYSFSEDGGGQRLYSPAGLVRLAAAKCGLSVPTDVARSAALETVCAALEMARPRQTAFGKFHAQAILLDAISKRLRLADYLHRFPDIDAVVLRRPIFIVAPFRTGTTFLHRLLAQDPENRWPRMWEVAYPPPADPLLRGDGRYFSEDGRIDRASAAVRGLHRAAPALAKLHPTGPDVPEECFGLLETSLMSHSFMFYADVPPYLEWLGTCDDAEWRQAYAVYAAQLRLLQWWHPGRLWVLKSPVHLWALPALLDVFPDACIVQLHRDPVAVVDSLCRLLAAYRGTMSKQLDLRAIGHEAVTYIQTALARAVAARESGDSACFIDVRFDDLVSDPIVCVQAIYERAGAVLTPGTVASMRRWLAQFGHAPRRAGVHAEEFAIDTGQMHEAFGAYDTFLQH